jgi:hypothetical protein
MSTVVKWRTVDTFDDKGTTVALQQRVIVTENRSCPKDSHRIVPVARLVNEG